MKTNVQPPSIDCFHGRVQADKEKQHAAILKAMTPGVSYTGQELSHATGLPPNIISARLFELREELKLVVRPMFSRKVCPFSNVSVHVHYRPLAQAELPLEMVPA
jgi:hypothetical protein